MSNNSVKRHSEFSQSLRALLDETDLFSREEWANFLGVSEAAISQWVNDHTLPRPDHLRMLLDVVAESDSTPLWVIKRFREMAAKPAQNVSPHALRLGRSVSEYLLKPLFDGFLRNLRSFPTQTQEQILLDAMDLCAKASEGRGPRDASFAGLVSQYPPGSMIDSAALIRIFGGRNWSSSVVIAKEPYEILGGAKGEFYENLVRVHLTSKPALGKSKLFYLSEKAGTRISEEKIQNLVHTVQGASQDPVANRVILASMDTADFESLRRLCDTQIMDSGLPRVVVAFDLCLPTAYGYSWYEDQVDGDSGVVLHEGQLNELAHVLSQLWQVSADESTGSHSNKVIPTQEIKLTRRSA